MVVLIRELRTRLKKGRKAILMPEPTCKMVLSQWYPSADVLAKTLRAASVPEERIPLATGNVISLLLAICSFDVNGQ